jgi:hypothetical protein
MNVYQRWCCIHTLQGEKKRFWRVGWIWVGGGISKLWKSRNISYEFVEYMVTYSAALPIYSGVAEAAADVAFLQICWRISAPKCLLFIFLYLAYSIYLYYFYCFGAPFGVWVLLQCTYYLLLQFIYYYNVLTYRRTPWPLTVCNIPAVPKYFACAPGSKVFTREHSLL